MIDMWQIKYRGEIHALLISQMAWYLIKRASEELRTVSNAGGDSHQCTS